MSILCSKEILNAIYAELSSAQKSVQVISAFCKLDALKKIESHINLSVSEKKLIVRFRLSDLLCGATDFEILEHCVSNGWKVFIRFDLHAKTYIVDNSRGIIGSENLTASGLSLGVHGNYEMAAFLKIEKEDVEKVAKLFEGALPVSFELIKLMKNQYEKAKADKNQNPDKIFEWNNEIKNLFQPKVETLFSHELPEKPFSKYLRDEQIEFLNLPKSDDITKIKNEFVFSNCYCWLVSTLKENGGCLYFGELSQKLHNSIVSDPKPYRKDVKMLLANLLDWIQELKTENVIIDRPNYSQRIRLRA